MEPAIPQWTANLRRGSTLLVLIALWASPYLLPFQALGISLVTKLGGARWVEPGSLPFAEAGHGADPGWYVALALGMAWPMVLAWTVVRDVPRWEARGTLGSLTWLLTAGVGVAAASSSWVLWPSLCFLCAHWETPSSVVKLHHIALFEGGVSLAVPSLFVLAARALGRPIDPARVPLHRWIAGIALFLFVTPPFLLLAKSGQLILFALAATAMWVRELPSWEARAGTWRIRLPAIALGAAPLLAVGALAGQRALSRPGLLPLVHLGTALVVASVSLAFIALSMSAADALAWALGRARSVRARMLVLGLTSAGLAFVLAGIYVPVNVMVQGESTPTLALTVIGKLVCAGVMVFTFSATLSRGLSRSLEQSVRAISEIRSGNLGVILDASGRDEVAAVARSFNQLVALLREAEFLEKINADLRARSAQLAQTLETLRATQADLVRSERMASIATLVKGIAHELNNPINYIAGNISPLERYCAFLTRTATELTSGKTHTADELFALTHLTERKDLAFVAQDLAQLTADIGEGARRAQLIISDLQNLTSVAQRGVERIDLHRLVHQTISLLKPGIPIGVRIEAKLDPVPAVAARAGQLEQVLVNLTDNALRAVGEKGTVRIYVGSLNGHAVIKVTDDGPGMSDDVKRQAFEPFFTTRAPGEGSGLGLAIVASIVRAHQGTVTIASEPGKGTEMALRLPLDSGLATAPSSEP